MVLDIFVHVASELEGEGELAESTAWYAGYSHLNSRSGIIGTEILPYKLYTFTVAGVEIELFVLTYYCGEHIVYEDGYKHDKNYHTI